MGLDFGLRRQLSHSDLRGLAKFLGEYCAPAPLDQFVPRAIEGLFQLVSCEGVSCGVVDPDRGEGSAVGYPSDFFSPESSKRVILIGSRELTPRFRETTGGFVAFSNLLGRAEFHRTGMYNEHFRNRDIEDVAVLPSLDSRGLGTFFSVERGRDFSDRDLALLNTVAAPLQAAFSNASRLTQLEEENGLLKSTLEAAGWNGLVVSHHARIYLESPQARKLLVSYFGCDASNDRLPDSVLRWIHASADRLRQPSTVELELSPFYVTRGGRRLVIRMLLHPAG